MLRILRDWFQNIYPCFSIPVFRAAGAEAAAEPGAAEGEEEGAAPQEGMDTD